MDALYQVVETLGKRARLLVNSTSLIVVSKLLLVRGRLAGLENISVMMTYCVDAAIQSTLRPEWITSPLPVRGHLIQHMGIEID